MAFAERPAATGLGKDFDLDTEAERAAAPGFSVTSGGRTVSDGPPADDPRVAATARLRKAGEMLGTVHYLLTVRKLDSKASAADRRTSDLYLRVRRVVGEAQEAIEESVSLVPLVEELRGWLANEVEAGDEALSMWVEKIDAALRGAK